ncbi:hypothetical protein [Desulfoluna spongiiphila]|uniref:Uncharacterized protein n=1 Tax=Desulfoluna spongiiphila TaxID=419481 RepID=A0A1G5FIK8_9BACT|nr:hypothetical protein [Desulfoluna spongiiphila]SCY38997.1 hypothetical protein SAMN05216233_10887 [Desulfoluna spongiiphila]
MISRGTGPQRDLYLVMLQTCNQDNRQRDDRPAALQLAVAEVMTLSLALWERLTGKGKVSLAGNSGLWNVHINPDGWERTQTLDRYLKAETVPKHPNVSRVEKTAWWVLSHGTDSSHTGPCDRLQTAVSRLMALV